MPAILANARQFKLNSDHPTDKIIYMRTGSLTLGAYGTGEPSAAHGLPFTPLVNGVWSFNSDFSVQYEFNTSPAPSGFSINDNYVEASSSQVRAVFRNNTNASQTIYYRIYGLHPSGAEYDAPSTAGVADAFAFNSDLSYMQLYAAGYRSQAPSPTPFIIPHSLGYRPQVLAWLEMNGWTSPINFELEDGGTTTTVRVGTVSVALNINSWVGDTTVRGVHWRIYLND